MDTDQRVIMLIEQDEPTRALYARALRREFQVFACGDTREALELRRAHTVHAVVLEPGGDTEQGWALLAALCGADASLSAPVILCSTLDERKRGMELGAALYLRKPVLPDVLVDAVRQVIDQRR